MPDFKIGDIVYHTATEGENAYNRDAQERVLFRIVAIEVESFRLKPLTFSHHCTYYSTGSYCMPAHRLVLAVARSRKDLEELYD